jgi:hypothetical protein
MYTFPSHKQFDKQFDSVFLQIFIQKVLYKGKHVLLRLANFTAAVGHALRMTLITN